MSTIALPAPPLDASATVRGFVNTAAQSFAGSKTFNVAGIGTANTVGVAARNSTAAAAGAQQYSPLFEFEGRGWGTTPVASQTVKGAAQLRPVQFTNAAFELWFLKQNGQDGSYNDFVAISEQHPGLGVQPGQPTIYLKTPGSRGFVASDTALKLTAGLTATPAYIDIVSGAAIVLQNTTASGTGAKVAAKFDTLNDLVSPGSIRYQFRNVGRGFVELIGFNSVSEIILYDPATGTNVGALVTGSNVNSPMTQLVSLEASDAALDYCSAGAGAVSVTNANATLFSVINGVTPTKVAYFKASGALFIPTVNGIGTAQTPGFSAENQTAAANAAQQYGPLYESIGRGWDSSGSASKASKWGWQTRPVQTAGNPEADLVFWYSTNGGAYAEKGKWSSKGSALTAGHFLSSAAPSVSINANAGTGATITLATGSTDEAGVFTIATGSAAWAVGTQFTFTFGSSFAFPNGCSVVCYPADVSTANAINQFVTNRTYYATGSTTGFVWGIGQNAWTGAITLVFNYRVTGF